MIVVNIRDFFTGLVLKDGLWHTGTSEEISYPAEASGLCFDIEQNSFWFKHRNDCIIQTLTNNPPHGFFLDVGGGNGFVSSSIQNSGYEVVLLEPSPVGAKNALTRGVEYVICSSLGQSGITPGTIPAIGIFDVLEHIEDDNAFLRELYESLMPGGTLYITVPAMQWLWSAEDDSAMHFRRYTLSGLIETLSSTGFQVTYSTYFFSFLILPILMFRSLPSRLKIRKGSDPTQTRNEHRLPSNHSLSRILEWLQKRELVKIKAGKRIPLGGSCLIVARKIPTVD